MQTELIAPNIIEKVKEPERFLDGGECCEWENCEALAESLLICPVCGAKELECSPHSDMMRNAPMGEIVIFNVTCFHRVQQRRCLHEKLS